MESCRSQNSLLAPEPNTSSSRGAAGPTRESGYASTCTLERWPLPSRVLQGAADWTLTGEIEGAAPPALWPCLPPTTCPLLDLLIRIDRHPSRTFVRPITPSLPDVEPHLRLVAVLGRHGYGCASSLVVFQRSSAGSGAASLARSGSIQARPLAMACAQLSALTAVALPTHQHRLR